MFIYNNLMIDTNVIQNGKYYSGSFKGYDETKGWFIGSFLSEDNPCKSEKIEVMYKEHKVGDTSKKHLHILL